MVPESSVVSQIRTNLKDRYSSGYPILKELLQNADDAESVRFLLDARHGCPGAENPLLRAPGLLVANDGNFNDTDWEAIRSLGKSYKAADHATIGKFGLGQKAVFHLCDAFVVHAVGVDRPCSIVLNPYFEDERTHDVTSLWEKICDKDMSWLMRQAGEYFQKRALVLWLPLRSKDLRPKPRAGFFDISYDLKVIDELVRADDLRVLLTLLRHLERVEICHEGQPRCLVELDTDSKRLSGPHNSPYFSFSGNFGDTDDRPSKFYVGRETTAHDCRFASLRSLGLWPKLTIDDKEIPEKGEPHGAATMLRAVSEEGQPDELRISWAVFLPTETTEMPLPLNPQMGRIHLVLHGYFFLDSGRRRIVSIKDPMDQGEPNNYDDLCKCWNTYLRDTVVLPLIPSLLKDARDKGVVTEKELPHLVASVVKSRLFQEHRADICRDYSLVRVLDRSDGHPPRRLIAWGLIPDNVNLRSLPATLSDNPDRIDQLFGQVDQLRESANITLFVDKYASMTEHEVCWTPAELGALFEGLSYRAFQSTDLARILRDVLSEIVMDDLHRKAIAPSIVDSVRRAMNEEKPLAQSDHIRDILNYVPREPIDPFFAISTPNRKVLRAMASSDAAILPLYNELLSPRVQEVPLADLRLLLRALGPLIDSALSDASAAALKLLENHNIRSLGCLSDFRDVKVFRARNPQDEYFQVLSFGELIAHANRGALFVRPPTVAKEVFERHLCTLGLALPDANPIIVEGELPSLTSFANKAGLCDAVNRSCRFGSVAHRVEMIRLLSDLVGDYDAGAIRRLCAGEGAAGYRIHGVWSTKLWNESSLPDGISRIVRAIVESHDDEYLVPSSVVAELRAKLNGDQRNELKIVDITSDKLSNLLVNDIDIELTHDERIALFRSDLPNDVLRSLPIHNYGNHFGSATGDFCFWEDEWPIPKRLHDVVQRVVLHDDQEAGSRQARIVRVWCPLHQIEVALDQNDAYQYQEEIIDALSRLFQDPDGDAVPRALLRRLRETAWLVHSNSPIAPEKLLELPSMVDDAVPEEIREQYKSVNGLPEKVRDRFRAYQMHLIMDRKSSLVKLADLISAAGLEGRLGDHIEYPVIAFTNLARQDIDLKLPGWRLLAVLLVACVDDRREADIMVSAFHGVSDEHPELAAAHLSALAEVIRRMSVARRSEVDSAYAHGFKAVASWSNDVRCRVFANTLVPTVSGEWRCGSEVIAEGDWVADSHVLAKKYGEFLRDLSG